MATEKVHPSKKHRDPFKTKTGKDNLKALSIKQLYQLLEKAEGKKKHKIAKEIARRTPIE